MNAPIGAGRFIGQRLPRTEDARLLTGRGLFTDDVVLAGMLHVAFVRSPIARGRIVSIDAIAAGGLPGVHAILTASDLAVLRIDMLNFFLAVPDIAIGPLASGRVAYVGDPVAMVIAADRYLAEDAAGLVAVEYAEEIPTVTISDAKRTGADPVHAGTESNEAAAMGDPEDDAIEAVLAAAPHLVSASFTHQRISQSPMEARGVVAARRGGELTVYISCQSPQLVARYLAQAFGLPPANIRVIAKDVGGSFGLKSIPWREEVAVIAAGMLLGCPLKWTEDRLENLTASNHAREQELTLRVGFDAEGRMLACHADYGINNGAYPHGADANIAVMMFLWAAYKMPQFSFLARGWYTNTPGLGAYRGPWAIETQVREVLLDMAARQIGIDPIELRRRNLITKADQPCTTPLGIVLEDITPAECLDKLLEAVDVAAFRAEQAAARAQGRHLGLGVAAYIEPTAGSTGIAVLATDVAQIRIEPTGRVTAILSTHSQGHGTQTTMAQVIAETLGVGFDAVSVFEDDSSRGGFGAGASGSRQAVAGGGAAIRASAILVDKVTRIAAHLLNANPAYVRIEDGMVHVAGVAEMTRSLREIAEIAYGEPDRLPPGMEPGLEAQYRYRPPPITFTSAAHACIVEVDTETGFVSIKRWVCAEDCGVMINPAVVEGQIAGGLAQAIGAVLLEDMAYDANGNPTTATYKDYLLPAISDVPDFEYIHASTRSKAEGGFRGVGEGGAIIGPPTLINAIADALSPFGARCLDTPLTPSRILDLIAGRTSAKRHEAAGPAAEKATMPPPPAPPAAPPSPAKAAVDGLWKMVLATPMGPQEMTGRFETDGETLRGRLDSAQGAQDFQGKVSGTHLKWEMKVTKPVSITLKYDIQIDGDKLTGKVKMGFFGTAKVTGVRA